MEMVLAVVAGAVVAGFVQGLSGFAFGLTAMSIWAWFLEPALAAQLAIFGALTGQVIAFFTVKRGAQWSLLWPFLLGGVLGVPLGLVILPLLDANQFRLGIGLLLVVLCPLMLLSERLLVVRRGGRIGDAISGWIGGVLSAIGGFSGAVPTLWATMRGFDKVRQRSVIQNFNLSMLAFSFASHLWQGNATWAMAPQLSLVALAVLVPVLLGARLYQGLSERAFRNMVLGLLTLSGIALLVSSLPAVLRGT